MNALSTEYYGNTLLTWLIAAAVLVVTFGALATLRAIALRRLHPTTTLRAFLVVMVQHTRYVFLAVIALAAAATLFVMPPRAIPVLRVLASVIVLVQLAWWAHGIVGFFVDRLTRERQETDLGSVTAIRALGMAARAVLWAVFGLAVIASLGVDVTALIAGLGIGGIAVALAVQNIVGDLFASVSIILDKPFVVGDFIKVGEQLGAVEEIGVKTTRLRSLSGEQLVFGNGDLLRSRIQNFRRMTERRVVFGIGVVYGTAPEALEAIPGIIREAIESQPATRVDRVHFKAYGDSSLDFEAVYYMLTPDYNRYMDVQQAVNLTIYRRFAAERIDFAFPTRTVVLRVDPTELDRLRGGASGDGDARRPERVENAAA